MCQNLKKGSTYVEEIRQADLLNIACNAVFLFQLYEEKGGKSQVSANENAGTVIMTKGIISLV